MTSTVSRYICFCLTTKGSTLFIKPINPGDGGRLVVPSQNADLPGVLYLEGKQQANGFYTLPPTIHIIPKEEVARLRGKTTIFKESEHVIVLSMHVSAYLDWSSYLK